MFAALPYDYSHCQRRHRHTKSEVGRWKSLVHIHSQTTGGIPEYFEPNALQVVCGGVPETTALLDCDWGTIHFTGSERVGKVCQHHVLVWIDLVLFAHLFLTY